MSRLGRVPAILRARGLQVDQGAIEQLERFEKLTAEELERLTARRGSTRTNWYTTIQALEAAAKRVQEGGKA